MKATITIETHETEPTELRVTFDPPVVEGEPTLCEHLARIATTAIEDEVALLIAGGSELDEGMTEPC